MKQISLSYLKRKAPKCHSWVELYRVVFSVDNPRHRDVTKFRDLFFGKFEHNHFTVNGRKPSTSLVKKVCPVCMSIFETRKGSPKEKTVCSRACSNTYFRSGKDHPNWREESYRSTCFLYHEKICVVCGEDKIIDVHHYDEDRANGSPDNLIPLCPTHHRYLHSKYDGEIRPIVEAYIKEFKRSVVQ